MVAVRLRVRVRDLVGVLVLVRVFDLVSVLLLVGVRVLVGDLVRVEVDETLLAKSTTGIAAPRSSAVDP